MALSKDHFEHQFMALRKCMRYNNNKKALVHMDGSDESFAAAAFCIKTVGLENVIGLITPDVHTKHVLAARHCSALNISSYTIPVTLSVADILNQIRVAGIGVSDKAILTASSMIASDVVRLVADELDAFIVDKYYLNDFEYQEFIRLYELPKLEEELI